MDVILCKQFGSDNRQLIGSPPAMTSSYSVVDSTTINEPSSNLCNGLAEEKTDFLDNLRVQQCLHVLQTQLPNSPELRQLESYLAQLDWFSTFHQTSQLLIGVVNPLNLTLEYANETCCRLLDITLVADAANNGHTPNLKTSSLKTSNLKTSNLKIILQHRLSEQDYTAVLRLYRRHLFHFVLQELYHVDPTCCRLLETPAMVALSTPDHMEPRYIEFWLRSQGLQVTRLNPETDEFADLNLTACSPEEWELLLADVEQLNELEQRFCLSNYQIQGRLVLEGLDVTERETIHRITQLLIDRDSILQPQKFRLVNHQLRSLFRTDHTIILTIEKEQIRVFIGNVQREMDTTTYPLELLQDSHTMKAIQFNRVISVRDLAQDCHTALGQELLQQGVRSLLLIPLVSQISISPGETRPHKTSPSSQVIGLVGLLSDRPSHFDGLDCCHARQLIPAFTRALTSAQRQLLQRRFIANIHPAVEWRFLQEVERRSLGLPPEPIIFNQVYPLYGISDIRGSSETRNSAIQADLLTQLQLGRAIVQAVCEAESSALAQQLQLDLQERMQRLQEKITVDAEVTEIRYLHNHLEAYFDYFSRCGENAIAAIQAYQDACQNEHNCVYIARAEYDQAIGQINALLRETWERWQQRMQQIVPHYCDIETTDGIDHMIYAGQSINPKFGKFQLRSLRYEQLRAMCDCARVAMRVQEEANSTLQMTHLVLVQDATVDIFHDETTERLFDVRGTRDTRYEIVKKRIDKAIDEQTQCRITQPEMLTIVYSTSEELEEYQQYLHYLMREQWISDEVTQGTVEPLQGVTGLKFIRVRILPGGELMD